MKGKEILMKELEDPTETCVQVIEVFKILDDSLNFDNFKKKFYDPKSKMVTDLH